MIINQESEDEGIRFPENYQSLLREIKLKLDKYREYIFYDEFTYLEEYLEKFEFYIKSLTSFGKNTLILLAAAVSDYYIPDENMNEHKIQSSESNQNICLYPVKKEL